MEPLTSGLLGLFSGRIDQRGADALGPKVPDHHRVLNPGVDEAIPSHVHEPNQSSLVTSSNPSETLLGEGGLPVPRLRSSGPERLNMKAIDLCVLTVATPPVADRHRLSIVPSPVSYVGDP